MKLDINHGTRNKLALMCGLLGACAGLVAAAHTRQPLFGGLLGFAISYITAQVNAALAFLLALIAGGLCVHWLNRL